MYIWLRKSKDYVTAHRNIIQSFKNHKTPPIPIMLKAMNASSLSWCLLLGVKKSLNTGSRCRSESSWPNTL